MSVFRVVPWVTALLFGCVLFAAPARAAPRGRLYVRVGPPAPVVQLRGAPPGPRYVWVDGYQQWTGTRYHWAPGRWVVRPRARAVWVPGRWVHHRRGWYWVDGRWR